MRRCLVMVLALAALAFYPCLAVSEEAEKSSKAQTLADLEAYLNGITTILAEFSQVAPDGTLTGGKFYLERPGKMRWQYNPPTPVLMVTSGSSLTFYDYQLEQVSYIPLDDTLAGFLTKKTISFSDPAISVDSVERANGAIRISLHQTHRPKDGSLALEFTDRPIILKNMVIIDVSGQITSVSLNNARFGVPLDPQLFVFKDPREGPRVKRN